MNQKFTSKLILTIVLSLLITNPILSQESNIEIGFEGGPSLTFLRGSSSLPRLSDPTFTSVFGVTFQKNFSKIFSLRTGLAYENKGAAVESKFTNNQGDAIGSYKSRFSYHYLNVPLLAKLSFGNKTKFFLNGGPFLGYLVKRTFTSPNIDVGGNSSNSTSIDNTEYSKRFDFGLSAGLGISFSLGERIGLNSELRYNYGLINSNSSLVSSKESVKSNSINFLIGLSFKLGSNN